MQQVDGDEGPRVIQTVERGMSDQADIQRTHPCFEETCERYDEAATERRAEHAQEFLEVGGDVMLPCSAGVLRHLPCHHGRAVIDEIQHAGTARIETHQILHQSHRAFPSVLRGVNAKGIQRHLQPLQHPPHGDQVLVHPEPHTHLGAVAIRLVDELLAMPDEHMQLTRTLLAHRTCHRSVLQSFDMIVQRIAKCHKRVVQILILRHHAQHSAIERLSGNTQAQHLRREEQFNHGRVLHRPLVGPFAT